jgi:hypothetical protein
MHGHDGRNLNLGDAEDLIRLVGLSALTSSAAVT